MMNITIYGTMTSGHQMIVSTIKKYLDRALLPYHLQEVSDVQVFLQKSIDSVPAIQIDDQPIVSLKANGAFNQSLRKIIRTMLEKKDFGQTPRILAPIDFSKASLNALMYAHRLATDLDHVLKVLHVYYPSAVEVNEVTYVDRELVEIRQKQLDETVENIDTDWAGDIVKAAMVDKEFVMGFPGDEIVAQSKEKQIEMVVMATTGESGFLKNVFGSVSTKVMSKAHSPVLLIPENAHYKKFNNVLLACDDIDEDDKYLQFLKDFVEVFDAKVHAVHIEDEKEELEEEKRELHEELSGVFHKDKVEIAVIHSDDVAGSIEDYAHANDIGLIVMSTERRGFFEKLFHKSTTKEMAIHSDIPLLVLKSED